jgi:hypothetical protein
VFPGSPNRIRWRCIYLLRACRSGGRRIHLKMSEEDEEIYQCLLLLLPLKSLLARRLGRL